MTEAGTVSAVLNWDKVREDVEMRSVEQDRQFMLEAVVLEGPVDGSRVWLRWLRWPEGWRPPSGRVEVDGLPGLDLKAEWTPEAYSYVLYGPGGCEEARKAWFMLKGSEGWSDEQLEKWLADVEKLLVRAQEVWLASKASKDVKIETVKGSRMVSGGVAGGLNHPPQVGSGVAGTGLMPKVVVRVLEGVLDEVVFAAKEDARMFPDGMIVQVRDYDVEGADELAAVMEDEDGNRYTESEWVLPPGGVNGQS